MKFGFGCGWLGGGVRLRWGHREGHRGGYGGGYVGGYGGGR